jgi:CRISPR-associated protein Cmr1
VKDTWTVRFHIVTPMFLGGADTTGIAEMRIPSLKGALRYWYRAIDPAYRQYEGVCFGSGGQGGGQSRFLMKLDSESSLQSVGPYGKDKSSIKYFSYFAESRNYLEADKSFTVTFARKFTSPSEECQADWRRLQASVWLLAHVGGLGFRSRRGFGSLRIDADSWSKKEIGGEPTLPIAHSKLTPETWKAAFEEGLAEIRRWFPGIHQLDHTVITDQATFHLYKTAFANWTKALDQVAQDLKDFRARRTEQECGTNQWYWANKAAIGMPIVVKKDRIEPVGADSRHASPIWIRIVKIGSQYYPFIAVLPTRPKISAFWAEKKGSKDIDILFTLNCFRKFLDNNGYTSLEVNG